VNDERERIRGAVEGVIMLATIAEHARAAGLSSQELAADERFLLNIASMLDEYFAKASLVTTTKGYRVTIDDQKRHHLREYVRATLADVNDGKSEGEAALGSICEVFAKAGLPLSETKLRKDLAGGAKSNVTEEIRMRVKALGGPAAAAILVAGRQQAVRAVNEVGNDTSALYDQGRGPVPPLSDMGRYALATLGLSAQDFAATEPTKASD
jgi:hypothetical protein